VGWSEECRADTRRVAVCVAQGGLAALVNRGWRLVSGVRRRRTGRCCPTTLSEAGASSTVVPRGEEQRGVPGGGGHRNVTSTEASEL